MKQEAAQQHQLYTQARACFQIAANTRNEQRALLCYSKAIKALEEIDTDDSITIQIDAECTIGLKRFGLPYLQQDAGTYIKLIEQYGGL